MSVLRSHPILYNKDDALANAGARMLGRSVQKMSVRLIDSAFRPRGGPKNKVKPTKSVHFEAHLESVVYFSQDDEPSVVLARISAVRREIEQSKSPRTLTKQLPFLREESACIIDLKGQSGQSTTKVQEIYISAKQEVTSGGMVAFQGYLEMRFNLSGWKKPLVSTTECEDDDYQDKLLASGLTSSLLPPLSPPSPERPQKPVRQTFSILKNRPSRFGTADKKILETCDPDSESKRRFSFSSGRADSVSGNSTPKRASQESQREKNPQLLRYIDRLSSSNKAMILPQRIRPL